MRKILCSISASLLFATTAYAKTSSTLYCEQHLVTGNPSYTRNINFNFSNEKKVGTHYQNNKFKSITWVLDVSSKNIKFLGVSDIAKNEWRFELGKVSNDFFKGSIINARGNNIRNCEIKLSRNDAQSLEKLLKTIANRAAPRDIIIKKQSSIPNKAVSDNKEFGDEPTKDQTARQQENKPTGSASKQTRRNQAASSSNEFGSNSSKETVLPSEASRKTTATPNLVPAASQQLTYKKCKAFFSGLEKNYIEDRKEIANKFFQPFQIKMEHLVAWEYEQDSVKNVFLETINGIDQIDQVRYIAAKRLGTCRKISRLNAKNPDGIFGFLPKGIFENSKFLEKEKAWIESFCSADLSSNAKYKPIVESCIADNALAKEHGKKCISNMRSAYGPDDKYPNKKFYDERYSFTISADEIKKRLATIYLDPKNRRGPDYLCHKLKQLDKMSKVNSRKKPSMWNLIGGVGGEFPEFSEEARGGPFSNYANKPISICAIRKIDEESYKKIVESCDPKKAQKQSTEELKKLFFSEKNKTKILERIGLSCALHWDNERFRNSIFEKLSRKLGVDSRLMTYDVLSGSACITRVLHSKGTCSVKVVFGFEFFKTRSLYPAWVGGVPFGAEACPLEMPKLDWSDHYLRDDTNPDTTKSLLK